MSRSPPNSTESGNNYSYTLANKLEFYSLERETSTQFKGKGTVLKTRWLSECMHIKCCDLQSSSPPLCFQNTGKYFTVDNWDILDKPKRRDLSRMTSGVPQWKELSQITLQWTPQLTTSVHIRRASNVF